MMKTTHRMLNSKDLSFFEFCENVFNDGVFFSGYLAEKSLEDEEIFLGSDKPKRSDHSIMLECALGICGEINEFQEAIGIENKASEFCDIYFYLAILSNIVFDGSVDSFRHNFRNNYYKPFVTMQRDKLQKKGRKYLFENPFSAAITPMKPIAECVKKLLFQRRSEYKSALEVQLFNVLIELYCYSTCTSVEACFSISEVSAYCKQKLSERYPRGFFSIEQCRNNRKHVTFPVSAKVDVWSIVLNSRNTPSCLDALILERRRKGLKTYGVPLHAFNGRDVFKDLIEELLDAAAYSEQAISELNKVFPNRESGENENIESFISTLLGQQGRMLRYAKELKDISETLNEIEEWTTQRVLD